jgi:formate dehydrogenase subunit gamma
VPVAEDRVSRHAAADRVFHWVTAVATLVLLGTAFLPILGLRFSWVPLHWMTGVVLTLATLFHLVRASFFQRLKCMWIRVKDIRDALAHRRAAKYTFAQKLMHAVMGLAILVVVATGVVMLAKVDTPFWERNPYLISVETWGVVYVLHGAASLVLLTLVMLHVYFSLLPEKRAYLRAMWGGSMSRAEAAEYHDPARWPGKP